MGTGLIFDSEDDSDPTYKTAAQAYEGLPEVSSGRSAITPPPSISGGRRAALAAQGYTPVSMDQIAGAVGAPAAAPGAAPSVTPRMQELMKQGYTPVQFDWKNQAPAEQPGEVSAGFQQQWLGTKGGAYGLVGALGRTTGIKGLQEFGEEGGKRVAEEQEAVATPSSAFTDVWEGKEGATWGGYGKNLGGAALEVLTEGLATSAATAAAGSLFGPVGTVAGGVTGLVGGVVNAVARNTVFRGLMGRAIAFEGKKIAATAAEQGLTVTAEQVADQSARNVLKYAAVGAAISGGKNTGVEIGSIYNDAVEQSEKTGQPVDMAKVYGYGLGAGAMETVGELLGISHFLRVGKGGSRISNAMRSLISNSLTEGSTEGVQTVLERLGAQQNDLGNVFTDPDARNDIMNSIAAGAGIGGLIGGAGGLTHKGVKAGKEGEASGLPTEEGDVGKIVPGSRRAGMALPAPPPSGAGAVGGTMGGLTLATATEAPSSTEAEQRNEQLWATRDATEATRQAHMSGESSGNARADVDTAIAELTGAAQSVIDNMKGPPINKTIGTVAGETAALAPKPPKAKGLQPPAAAPITKGAAATAIAAPPTATAAGKPAIAAPPEQKAALVTATNPEPVGDINAQITAMMDPKNPKDAVFIAKGTEMPKTIPPGVARIHKPEGLYLTRDAKKALTISGPNPLTDEQRAVFLGIPEAKAAVVSKVAPVTVSAKDAKGNVVSQAVTNATGPNVAAVQSQQPAGGHTEIKPVQTTLDERQGKVDAEPPSQPVIDKANDLDLMWHTLPEKTRALADAWVAAAHAGTDTEAAFMSFAKAVGQKLPAGVSPQEALAWHGGFDEFAGLEHAAAPAATEPPGATKAKTASKKLAAAAPTEKGGKNAQEVRGDQGQAGEGGKGGQPGVQRGAEKGGDDLQRTTEAGTETGDQKGRKRKVKEELPAEPTLTIAGEDMHGEKTSLRLWVKDDKIQRAELQNADGSTLLVNTKSKDTLHTVLGRVEEEFTPEGSAAKTEEGETIVETAKERLARTMKERDAERNAALKKLRRSIRQIAPGTAERGIAKNASDEERSAFVNDWLARDFGVEKSVELVETPEKWKSMATVLGNMLDQKIQFFNPTDPDVARSVDGFKVPGDPDTIYVSTQTKRPAMFIFGHEIGHNIKEQNPKLWKDFMGVIEGLMDRSQFKRYTAKLKALMEIESENRGESQPSLAKVGATAIDEASADAVGTSFMDPKFWDLLYESVEAKHRPLVMRVIQQVAALLKRIARALSGAKEVGGPQHEMFKDVSELHRAVRDLIVDFRDIAPEKLTDVQLTKEASQHWNKNMEPDEGAGEYKWKDLSKEGRAYWTEVYDEFRTGDVSAKQLTDEFDRINERERMTAKTERASGAVARSSAYQQAETLWNEQLATAEDPDFEDLPSDHKNYFIRTVYDRALGKRGATSPTKAYDQIKGWIKESEAKSTEEEKRVAAISRAQAKEKAAAEKKAAAEEKVVATEKQRLASIAKLVEAERPAIEERMANLTEREQEIMARHFGATTMTDKTKKYLSLKVAEVLADPKAKIRDLPADIRPVVRRIVGGVKYSRAAMGYESSAEEAAVAAATRYLPTDDPSAVGLMYKNQKLKNYERPKRGDQKGFALALQDRTQQILERTLDLSQPEDRVFAAKILAKEIKAALKYKAEAAKWYRDNLSGAIRNVAKAYPDVLTDPKERSMFTLALAITSNGNDIDNNVQMALQSYEHYRKTGEFLVVSNGKEAKSMEKGFHAANDMLARMGAEKFASFLNSKFSVAEMSRMGLDVGGEAKDQQVYGSAMFGPKVGAAFYQNLNDNFDALTMDRWFMRTIGRVTGDLVVNDPEKTAKQADRFRKALSEAPPEELKRFGVDQRIVDSLPTLDNHDLFNVSGTVYRNWVKQEHKNGTEMAAAARTWQASDKKVLDAPHNSSHRIQIRDTMRQALDIVNKGRAEPIALGDAQALLWYPEKDLYREYNATNAAGSPTDYEQATARFLAPQRQRAGGGQGSATEVQHPVGTGSRQAALDEKQRRRLIRSEIARQFYLANPKRDEAVSPYQSPRSYRARDRKGLGPNVRPSAELAPHVLQTYLPDLKYANAMAVAGVSTPPIHELEATPEAAALFRDKLIAAQKTQGAAGPQVTVFDAASTPDEAGYDQFRLFLAADGRAGFAIKPDGEVASVFKALPVKGKADDLKSVSVSSLHAATQMGGRWLNAFDTYLPDEYAIAGFHAVARIPFNTEFAPTGWDYEANKQWNDGKPDVVWMTYSEAAPEMYDKSYAKDFDEYDEAETHAKSAVAENEPLREMRGRISYSRKDMLNPVEVYATKGEKINGMASFNVPNQTWFVYKALTPDGDIRDDYTEQTASTVADAMNLLRGPGIKLIRRKESPVLTEGHRDVWGRGPDVLYDIDTSPVKADNRFTKTVDAVLSKTGLKGQGPGIRRKLIRMAQDAYIDVKGLQQNILRAGGVIDGSNNVYQKITLFSGKTGNALDSFKQKYADPVENKIKEAMKKGATLNDIETYQIAEHAEERNKVIEQRTNGKIKDGSGMTTKEAQDTLRAYQSAPYHAELQSITKILDDISTFKVDLMEKSGLINKDTADGLRQYQHYRPLKGLDEDDSMEITGGMGVGTGFSGKASLLKYATGRQTLAKHVISHTLLDAEAKIIRAGKNEVAVSLAELAKDFPDPKFWTLEEMKATKVFNPETGTIRYQPSNDRANPNLVMAYKDGVPIKIDLKDDSFAEAVTNSQAGGNHAVFEFMRRFNKYLAAMMTSLNPEWALINAARDAQTAYFNISADNKLPPGMAKKVLAELLAMKGHKEILKAVRDPNVQSGLGKWYKELEEQGGITKFFSLDTLKDRADRLAEMENRLLKKGVKGKLADYYTRTHAEAAIKWLEDINATIEAAPRVIAYKTLVQEGWSKADAADYAKNLTVNFNRKGSQKALSSMYLFFNPALQGTARLYEALKTPQGKVIATSLFGLGLAAGLSGNAGGDDDKNKIPDYQQLSDWERSTNIILWPHGPKIPLPYGWNAFYAMGNYIADTFFGRSPMSASWAGIKAASNAFNPIGGADSKTTLGWLAKQAAPTISEPLLQFVMNENRFGGQVKRTQDTRFGPKQPESAMGSMQATSTSKALTSGINALTGGSAAKAGAIDINPDSVDFLFANLFPGVASSAARSVSTIGKIGAGEETETKDWPVARRLWTEPSKGKIYEALVEAKQQIGEFQNVAKRGDPAERAELAKEHPGWGGVAASFTVYGKQVGDLQKRKAAIIDGKLKVPDVAAEKTKIDHRIIDLENRMLNTYNTVSARW